MNGILSNNSDNKLHGVLCPKTNESVETAGSLAMGYVNSMFDYGACDEFFTSNPFAIDYSLYSDCGCDTIAWGGFLSSFSNAVSTLGSAGGDCTGASFSAGGGDCGCSCSCGGFTSVC